MASSKKKKESTHKSTDKTDEEKAPGAPDLPSDLKDEPEEESEPKSGQEEAESNPKESESSKSDLEDAIESKQTDEAVDDIVRKEGDELLETQDKANADAIPKDKKPWWKRKWFAWALILILLAAVALMAVPKTRYTILNTLGVRVSSSVVVVDKTTGQPLKNVNVTIGETSTETGGEGRATLEQLKQGPQQLTIERIAFTQINKEVTLGWGSNPLGTFELSPSGAQYTFVVRDFLSNEPIKGAEVSSGKAVASADDKGEAVLTLRQTEEQSEVSVSVSAEGYRADEVSLAVNTTDNVNVTLVPRRKAVFAASEGRFNVYAMHIDGKNREVLLEGTGNEDSNMSLSVSADGARAAFVSTRENIEAGDGSLLQSLSLINVGDSSNKILDRGVEVQLIDWVGATLIYQMTVPGAGGDSGDRQRLISYDYKNDERAVLARANEFKSVSSAQGDVYYSAGDGLIRVSPGGGGEQNELNADVSRAYRSSYDTLTLQADDGWYSFNLSNGSSNKIPEPANPENYVYVSDQAGDKSLWVGDGALMNYNLSSGQDSRLLTRSDLSHPVRWLTNTVALYRAGNAEYAVSTQGGDSRRVTGVTDTSGIVQTY